MDTEPVVTYTLKEILDSINGKLDQALKRMDGKADASKVEEIDTRLGVVERHIEHTSKNSAARERWRAWAIPAIIAALAVAVTILQAFHI